MTGTSLEVGEGVLDSTAMSMANPSTSPGSPLSSSSAETRDGGLLDDSFTSLSGSASTVDVDELDAADGNKDAISDSTSTLRDSLQEAFAENIVAKMCKVAIEALHRELHTNTPYGQAVKFPEYCPQTGSDAGKYVLREPEFWTCGFFPGTLFTLLERAIRFPQSLTSSPPPNKQPSTSQIRSHLRSLCRAWSEPLHAMADRTDTHDLGFIIMPALRLDWELTSNERSLGSIIRAAHSLARRYVPSARAIRSWDLLRRRDIEILDPATNCLLIIDSMCNLDLLYYAAAHSGDASLANMATAHAHTLLTTHLRPETTPDILKADKTAGDNRYTGPLYSTCHVANLDPTTGALKQRLTAQGYADTSTWARGQAWAILGYAQAYTWTNEPAFLRAACGCAEYFLLRLEVAAGDLNVPVGDKKQGSAGESERRKAGRYVPPWDFDAPLKEGQTHPTRDSSAGVIAANGMLVLSQALAGSGQPNLAAHFREKAVAIVKDTLELALAREKVRFKKVEVESGGDGDGDGQLVAEDVLEGRRFDALLKFGTANNNAFARKRYSDHGLVYGDYYLVEFGNRLLRMGLV